MKLKIDGTDYDVPVLTAADYEDYDELFRKTAQEELHWLDRNKAVVGIICAKMTATFPNLTERSIKSSIPMPKLRELFSWVCHGKNGDAQPPSGESPK
jgi:hypothetical protein